MDKIVPSTNSSKNDFDFLIGKWKIKNRKLKTRLNNCSEWLEFGATGEMFKILNGLGNTDNFIAMLEGKPFEGRSTRLFNPKTKLWSIYWADSNAGVLDQPVIGSFHDNIGNFYTKDVFNGKEIIVVFNWDKTNPAEPVWSQAFSADEGRTWEWNWYMNFYKTDDLHSNQILKVLELRNYLLKPNLLDRFQQYFQDHFIESQNILNGHTLGQFKIKDIDNRFFWLRGFTDMATRLDFLKCFYDKSDAWKRYAAGANEMMVDSDQVHVLRPLNHEGDWQAESHGILKNSFLPEGKNVVIEYYFAIPGKLGELIDVVRTEVKTNSMLNKEDRTTLWITEQSNSEFRHPVVQNPNLLVAITSFQKGEEYQTQGTFDHTITKTRDLLSDRQVVVLYPFL